MVKLSQQLAKSDEEIRQTRTQRVREKQAYQKYVLEQSKEKERFERKKEIAEELQETDFADIKDLKEYEEKYQQLDPEIKPFFSPPETVEQEQTGQISETKIQVQEKITFTEQEERAAREKRDARYRKNQTEFNNSTSANRQETKIKKDLSAEKEYELRAAYLRGYKEGLGRGLGELQAGKNISFSAIKGHASEVGSFEKSRERAALDEDEFNRNKEQEIRKLEAQGYKPFIIEKSFKGKTEEAYLEFVKDGDWQRVATFQAPSQTDISKLQKSQLGRIEVERSLFFGDREFKFKSNLQLYKDPTGKLSTKYGSIGKNEDVIIKQAQDKAYKDWQQTQEGKSFNMVFKSLEKGKDIPYDFGGQQTISDKPTTQLITKEQYYAQKDKPSFLATITKPIANLYGKIPSGRYYYNPKLFGIGAGISPFKTSERSIDLTTKIEAGSEKLGEISGNLKDWAFGKEGKEKLSKLDLDLETKYQGKYQATFESKYMKSLIYEETTFEKASKSFEESKEAKLLQREYQEEYGEKYKKISSDVPILRAGAGGLGMAGLTLGQLGLKAIRTPKSTVLSAATIYGGVKVLKAIPTGVSYAATGGLGIYGTYKFVSPTSTIEQRGSGLLTAIISGSFLGYGAYRSLRSPVIKAVKIKPKLSSKVVKPVGIEKRPIIHKDVFGKVTRIEKTVYPKTLSRQVIEGRKTIVTTKGRVLLEKYTKIKLDPIYKGVPKTPSGYQKALKKLTKYGYSPSQAKATLRYVAPKVIDTEIKSISVLYSGDAIKYPYAKSKTKVTIKQSKIDLGGGLKTRGAKTIQDVYRSEKMIIGTYKGKTVIKEAAIRMRSTAPLGKTTTQYERTILAKAGDVKKGQVIVGGSKDLKILLTKEYRYQNLKEVFRQQQTVPKKLRELYGGQKSKLIKTQKDPFTIDERELTGIKASKFEVPKPSAKIKPIEEMSSKELKNLIRDLQKVYGKGKVPKVKIPTRADKPVVTFDYVDDAASKSAREQVSKYYGTGQYERTGGGISPQEMKGLDLTQTRSVQNIDLKLIKHIKDIQGKNVLSLGVTTQLLNLKAAQGLTEKQIQKKDLKMAATLKNLIKEDYVLKQKQTPALKQAPSLKVQLKAKLEAKAPSPSLLTPTIIIPKIPTVTPTTFYPKTIFIPSLQKKIREKRAGKTKVSQEFAFLPDFTSRALGLDPDVITGKQAQAKIKKILTGLEIRRPVKIKR